MRSTRRLVTSDLQLGTRVEQFLDERRRVRHLLEVVDHEKRPAEAAKVLGDRLDEREVAALPNSECVGDRRGNQAGIGERREVDEPDAIEVIDQLLGHLDGEACLAGAARSGQRELPDPRAQEQILDAGDLRRSTDERGALRRQVVGSAVGRPRH